MPERKKKGRTQTYYDSHPEAYAKKKARQKAYDAKPSQIKKRAELVKLNRDRGVYGNGDGLDVSHTKNGIVMKPQSVNRGSKSDMPGDRRTRAKGRKRAG